MPQKYDKDDHNRSEYIDDKDNGDCDVIMMKAMMTLQRT